MYASVGKKQKLQKPEVSRHAYTVLITIF